MPSGHVIQRINVPNLQKNGQETEFATWKPVEIAMDPMLAMFLTEVIAKVSKQLSVTRALLDFWDCMRNNIKEISISMVTPGKPHSTTRINKYATLKKLTSKVSVELTQKAATGTEWIQNSLKRFRSNVTTNVHENAENTSGVTMLGLITIAKVCYARTANAT